MSTSPKDFEIILVDLQKELCEHWAIAFKEFDEIKIHNGLFKK